MQYFSQGKLCALWQDSEAPKLDDSVVAGIYRDIFRPTLEQDVAWLYNAMVKSVQKTDAIDFDEYLKAITTFKEIVSDMSLPKTKELNSGFIKLRTDFMDRKLFGFTRAATNLARDHEETNLPISDKHYISARISCIGYDTSAALAALGAKMKSPEGRSAMLVASMQGSNELNDLLVRHWLNERKAADICYIHARMMTMVASIKLLNRLQTASAAAPNDMPHDDVSAAIRVSQIRVVAGKGFKAA